MKLFRHAVLDTASHKFASENLFTPAIADPVRDDELVSVSEFKVLHETIYKR